MTDTKMKSVPKVRFEGFTDDWEERKLIDVAQFNPKTVLPDEFEYVDLESVIGTEMISHRTESKDQAPSRAQRLAKKGDVFYQTVRPYQMNNYLYDLPYDNYVFSTGYAQMRPNIDSYFLLNSVQNKQFVQHVLDRSTGTSYPAINSSDLSNIEINVPSKLAEQQKIGSFFKQVDNTIALHQRKHDSLLKLKQAYLQKMFPKNGQKTPELRFGGFTDDWEQRKLGDLVNVDTGSRNHQDAVQGGRYPFYVRSENIEALDEYDFDETAILVPGDGRIGEIFHFVQGKFALHQRVYKLDGFTGVMPEFLIQLLRHGFRKHALRMNAQGTVPSLRKPVFTEWQVLIPNTKEQKPISYLLRCLDKTIALHQQQLDNLKQLKKWALQNLFV